MSDERLRAAYRRLVQLHHPDHNDGSVESARRFEEIQEAYAQVTRLRQEAAGRGNKRRGGQRPRTARQQRPRTAQQPSPPAADPEVEARLADMQRQVREAHRARERAQRAAREAGANAARRPTDEELGYVRTDDSFSKLLDDARDELAKRLSGSGSKAARRRVADLIDEVAAKLRGDRPTR